MTILLVLAIIGLPLSASLLCLALRRWQGYLVVGGQAVGVVASLRQLFVTPVESVAWRLPFGIPDYPFQLLLSRQSALIAAIVAFVALLVSIYALGYMKNQPAQTRFWATFGGFVVAMQLFVFAGDWISLLIGWELMSLASFLLIGFYTRRPEAVFAAKRAFMTTRTGDIGLYLAVLLLVSTAGTSFLPATLTAATGSIIVLSAIGLLIAGAVKAAQFPFDGWLRDAMAGPTPVSALLHSATMVAAGFLLLLKVQPLLTPELSLMVALVGGITGVVAGIIAFGQTDLKRMLAASTSSQLGFMFLALGAGSTSAALFFFVAQAFIKSSLFMAAGVFQQAAGSTRFNDLHGLSHTQRSTFIGFVIAGLGIAAIPPLAGFWSKDAVIAATLTSPYQAILVPLAVLGALITAVYISKAIWLLSSGRTRQGKTVTGLSAMLTGLYGAVLAIVLFGVFTKLFERFNGTELPQSLFAMPLGLISVILGLSLGVWLSIKGIPKSRFLNFAANGFYASQSIEKVLSSLLTRGSRGVVWADVGIEKVVYNVGHTVTSAADYTGNSLERYIQNGVDGTANYFKRFADWLRVLQSGLVHRELIYSFYSAGWVVVVGAIIVTLKELFNV